MQCFSWRKDKKWSVFRYSSVSPINVVRFLSDKHKTNQINMDEIKPIQINSHFIRFEWSWWKRWNNWIEVLNSEEGKTMCLEKTCRYEWGSQSLNILMLCSASKAISIVWEMPTAEMVQNRNGPEQNDQRSCGKP